MARISLVEEEDHPELAEIVTRIRGARRGSLINVYKLLLHAPALAATWFDHLNAVRWKTGLDGRLREMVIIRIGLVNEIDYVFRQHVPKLALAEGLTLEECHALSDWRASAFFSPRERAALAYADAMTRDVKVSDDIFDEMRHHFDETQVVELTVLIGTYNMHTRVVGALRIDNEI